MKQYQLKEVCNDIIEFLAKSINKDGKFSGRSFYGETFTALSMIMWDKDRYKEEIHKLLQCYSEKDKSKENFHWEFNNYALNKIYMYEDFKAVEKLLFPLRFKGTTCTNWTLLRNVVRLMNGELDSLYEIDDKIDKYQMDNGLIKDDKDVNSFQYHCFMASIIIEIYDLTGNDRYKKCFIKAVDFISNLMLSNGCSIYIGRGQEQLFGYGPLIYIYEVAFNITKNKKYKYFQSKCFSYIMKYKNENGVFPLVLNSKEKNIPCTIDVNNKEFLGWYSYNNYYDYLPFFVFYLIKCYEIFEEIDISENLDSKYNDISCYYDDMYVKYNNGNYSAVMANVGGYWTNDMPIPIISYNKEIITPCYGGEQFGSNLYTIEDIPLPYIKKTNIIFRFNKTLKRKLKEFIKRDFKDIYYFRNELKYILSKIDNDIFKLHGENKYIYHDRIIKFEYNRIVISDKIIFRKKIKVKEFIPINLSFFKVEEIDENNFKIDNNAILRFEDISVNRIFNVVKKGNCALGELEKINLELDYIKFKKESELNFKYSINLI